MKKAFLFFATIFSVLLAQAQFTDDFSDGNISSNPTWEGMIDRFVVNSGELQLSAPQVTDESYLVVPSAGLDNGVWEFYVKMDFGTSSGNYSRVYLMSTSANLLGALNGYYVLIGQTADEISLYRQDGTATNVLIDGVDKSIEVDPVEVRIRVTRDASGNWELLQDLTGGTTFSSAGTANDGTYSVTNYFGVRCTYTSTRHDLFFFDDFNVSGSPILDTEPPALLTAEAQDQTHVEVNFSEELDPSSVQVSDFSIDQGATTLSMNLMGSQATLTTSQLVSGRTYNLTVNNVTDNAGNNIAANSIMPFQYLIFSVPEENELILNEVLFNPKSGGVDFVELYNNSVDSFFDLQGWKLARTNDDGELDQIKVISDSELSLSPGEYLAITEDIELLVLDYPNAIDDNFYESKDIPTYNDDEGTIILLSPDEDTVQFFQYTDDMHYSLLEDDEGVSLERVSFTAEVNNPNSWRSAASTVGFATPGSKNSQTLNTSEPIGELSIEPKVFIPGNAGSGRDFTTINYSFEMGGKFANIVIYDQSGRPVKELANGVSLPTSGFFRWDGTTDQGRMARMGYHVVVFEVIDSQGNKDILRETVVVGRDF